MSAIILEILNEITVARVHGRDLIEEPTREGGIFVDDETLAIVADIEIVVTNNFNGDFKKFHHEFLMEIKRAHSNGDDPIEELRLWLRSFSEETFQLSA